MPTKDQKKKNEEKAFEKKNKEQIDALHASEGKKHEDKPIKSKRRK